MVAEDINPDQLEQFAQGIAYGFTAMQSAEEVGLDITPIEARVLARSDRVRELVDEIGKIRGYDDSLEHIRVAHQLEVDRDFAIALGNPGAAIQATIARAKVLGVFVERSESNTAIAVRNPDQLSPEEWAAKFGGKLHTNNGNGDTDE